MHKTVLILVLASILLFGAGGVGVCASDLHITISGVEDGGVYFTQVQPQILNPEDYDKVYMTLNGIDYDGSVIAQSGDYILNVTAIKDSSTAQSSIAFTVFNKGPHSFTWNFRERSDAPGWRMTTAHHSFTKDGLKLGDVQTGGSYLVLNSDQIRDFTISGSVSPNYTGNVGYVGVRLRFAYIEAPIEYYYGMYFKSDGQPGLYRKDLGTTSATQISLASSAITALKAPYTFKIVVENNVVTMYLNGELIEKQWQVDENRPLGTIGLGAHFSKNQVLHEVTLTLPGTDPDDTKEVAAAPISAMEWSPFPTIVDQIPFSKENFHLYVLLGQSNMVGRGTIAQQDKYVVEHAYLLNQEGQWELAQPGTYLAKPNDPDTLAQMIRYKGLLPLEGYNRYASIRNSTTIRPGLNCGGDFARVVTSQVPDVGIGIISNAIGGTLIRHWQKGAKEGYFDAAVTRVKEAMEHGTLKGILWLQGESDRTNTAYMSQLATFAQDLRQALGVDESVVFIASQTLPQSKFADFNNRIASITQHIPNSGYIVSTGTTDIGDELHLDAQSQRLLGRRFGLKVLDMVYDLQLHEDALR